MKTAISILLSACVAFVSCQEELQPGTPLYPVGEENFDAVKVYVNELDNNNVYKSYYNSTPLFVEIPEDTASFHVQLNRALSEDVVVKASLEGLPDGTWKFVDGHGQVTVPAGSKVSSSDIRLVLLENETLIHQPEYTDAKVRLEVVSGPAEVGANLNTFTWNIRNRYTIIHLVQVADADLDQSTRYIASDVDIITTFDYPDRVMDGLFTGYVYGSKATFDGSGKLTYDQYLIFDLREKTQLDAVGFVPYLTSSNYSRYWISEAECFISNDGENWTSVGTLSFGEPAEGQWALVTFYEPVVTRFFKMRPLGNYGHYYSSVFFSEAAPFGPLSMRGIRITPEDATVRVGKTITLTATKVPSNAPEEAVIAWSSDNPSVATVDAEGNVTGVSEGIVKISASANGFARTIEVAVKPYAEPAFFGSYTMHASTSNSSTSTTERHFELLKVDEDHVSVRFSDESQMRVIDGKEAWLVGTFPLTKVDGDHYRLTWNAGAVFSENFLTASGQKVTLVSASLFRGGYTGNSYRSLDPETSVDIDFVYDEASGKFKGSFGESHWGTNEVTAIGLYYEYLNSSGRTVSGNWLLMCKNALFEWSRD